MCLNIFWLDLKFTMLINLNLFEGNNKKRATFLIGFTLFLLCLFLYFWTLPNFNNQGTIKIWDRSGTLLYESAGNIGRKSPVTYEKLPKNLINAAIASEDNTFWNNSGVDFRAIFRSLVVNIQAGKIVTGASTITQQLARTSVISPNQLPERNLLRKIREILIALRINSTHSKKEIITMYFNQMYFGNLAYGAEAASETYFNKDVNSLSLAESAFLIGLLSSPDARNPYTNFYLAQKQEFQVLDSMVRNKFISKEVSEEAKKEKITLSSNDTKIKAPHFIHYVLDNLSDLHIPGGQGINVYTTLDYPTFRLSNEIAKLWVDKLKDEHGLSNASVVLLKNDTGEIISMMGGVNYFDVKNSGQENMTVALRQPGSALKPVTYAAAFMKNYTPATLIYDVKKVYKTKKGEGFTPNNYDGRFHGLVLAREALASSFNLPAVEMLSRVGIPFFLDIAKKMGITTFTQADRYDLSLTLGGGEVKLIDLTNVFASFARGGKLKKTYAIEKVTTDEGKILYKHTDEEGVSALGKNSAQIAYLITNILSDPKARIPGFGEKNPLVLSHPAAVKTGTTTDWHDNWTVGYTPSYTVGVWVGNNNNAPMREITGVIGAAPIWNQFFEEFLKGKPVENFTVPDRIKKIEICSLSGKLLDGLCPEKTVEVFLAGTEPKEKSNLHKEVLIDTRNNLLAGKNCPQEFTEKKVFINYPSEVYSWAVSDGQEVIPTKYSDFCSDNSVSYDKPVLEITNPRNKAVFESAPLLVSNEKLDLEVNVSSDISQVNWYVDRKLFTSLFDFPFTASWSLVVGKHTVSAVGFTKEGKQTKTPEASFQVLEFHDYRN